jgi:hypothetical protein
MEKQMTAALAALWALAASIATPEQIKQVADQYEVEAWQLEGFYFDAVEQSGDE